ncbi:AP endonuclease [Hymenopellis radicata]|nr:AP endonuclease [Hymenopellis radicata]
MGRTRKASAAALDDEEDAGPRKRSRTSKAQKEVAPLKPRPSSAWKVGAHVSAAGGVENAVTNAVAVGANAFSLFVKSQRKWTSPDLKESSISAFKSRLEEHGYDARHVLPHGSYLINLGNPHTEKREKSYECFVDDLRRCAQLGLVVYNFHPGSTVGDATPSESMAFIAECLNRAHKDDSTGSVITVLENMAGAGNIIGGDFGNLGEIIKGVEDKSRVGVCLDTCHMFAAGYDIRTKDGWDETMSKFDEQVGLKYLRGMHLNDSKTELGSHKDRHENIGLGHIGLSAFRHILADPRVQDIPLVLETPSFEEPEVWATEIEALQAKCEDEEAEKLLLETIRAKVNEVGGGKSKASKAKKTTKRAKKKTTEEDEDELCDH